MTAADPIRDALALTYYIADCGSDAGHLRRTEQMGRRALAALDSGELIVLTRAEAGQVRDALQLRNRLLDLIDPDDVSDVRGPGGEHEGRYRLAVIEERILAALALLSGAGTETTDG